MKMNYILKCVAILTILSGAAVVGNDVNVIKADSSIQTSSQAVDIVTFKDKAVESGALLSLSIVLERPTTISDLTQENLNKIQELAIFGSNSFSTLDDLIYMPNLTYVGIQSLNCAKVIDSTPLENLKYLQSFTFWQTDSQLTSLTPLLDKPLTELIIHSLPVSDGSEKLVNEMSNLTNLDMMYFSNTKKIEIGSLDNLPNLKEINLNAMNLTEGPTLKSSTKLEYVNYSNNALTSVPILPHSENLWHVGMDENKIDNYDNIKELVELPNSPSVSLISNILTSVPSFEIPTSKSLDLSGNFIIGEGLKWQHSIKTISEQSVTLGQEKEIDISFEDEGGYPMIYDLTDFQKEFLSLDNMSVETSNDNVSIEKGQNSITVKANKKGTTKVILSYSGNLKTQFDINVQ